MTLSDQYRRQLEWRSWGLLFDALPDFSGRTILDLGCGPGDQAAELVRRGARVIGFDGNEELLDAARAKGLATAEFHRADLRDPDAIEARADGIWCSFAAAYFPELGEVLASWSRALQPGGWIALTEIDDLFGHGPLSERTEELLAGYARDSLAKGRYDFHMGRKLARHLARAGFSVTRTLEAPDREFSFQGPASDGVREAWRARFDRMPLLAEFCGAQFERLRAEFLACLERPDHVSRSSVVCCVAQLG